MDHDNLGDDDIRKEDGEEDNRPIVSVDWHEGESAKGASVVPWGCLMGTKRG